MGERTQGCSRWPNLAGVLLALLGLSTLLGVGSAHHRQGHAGTSVASEAKASEDAQPYHPAELCDAAGYSKPQGSTASNTDTAWASLEKFVGGFRLQNTYKEHQLPALSEHRQYVVQPVPALERQNGSLLPAVSCTADLLHRVYLQTTADGRRTLAGAICQRKQVDRVETARRGGAEAVVAKDEDQTSLATPRWFRAATWWRQGQWQGWWQRAAQGPATASAQIHGAGCSFPEGYCAATCRGCWRFYGKCPGSQAAGCIGEPTCQQGDGVAGARQEYDGPVLGCLLQTGGYAVAQFGQRSGGSQAGHREDQEGSQPVRDGMGPVYRSAGQDLAGAVARAREIPLEPCGCPRDMDEQGQRGLSGHCQGHRRGPRTPSGGGRHGGRRACVRPGGYGLGGIRSGKSLQGRQWFVAAFAISQFLGGGPGGSFSIPQTPHIRDRCSRGGGRANKDRQDGFGGGGKDHADYLAPCLSPWLCLPGTHGPSEDGGAAASLAHSVESEDDYVSPWLAKLRALRLSFECRTDAAIGAFWERSNRWLLRGPSHHHTPHIQECDISSLWTGFDDGHRLLRATSDGHPVPVAVPGSGACRRMDNMPAVEPSRLQRPTLSESVEGGSCQYDVCTKQARSHSEERCTDPEFWAAGSTVHTEIGHHSSLHHERNSRLGCKVRFSSAVEFWFPAPTQCCLSARRFHSPSSVNRTSVADACPARDRGCLHSDAVLTTHQAGFCPPSRGLQGTRKGFFFSADCCIAAGSQFAQPLPVPSLCQALCSRTNLQSSREGTSLSHPPVPVFCSSEVSVSELSSHINNPAGSARDDTADSCVADGCHDGAARALSVCSSASSAGLPVLRQDVDCLSVDSSVSGQAPAMATTDVTTGTSSSCIHTHDSSSDGFVTELSHIRNNSSGGLVAESSNAGPPDAPRPPDISPTAPFPLLQCPKLKPHSKSHAVAEAKGGRTPRRPAIGPYRTLSSAATTPIVSLDDELDGEDLSTFTSFDEIQGDRTLIGRPWWTSQHYMHAALASSALPGQPTVRVMGFELPTFPSPQVALTQDRGGVASRAIVFDAQPIRGSVETLDCVPGQTLMSALTSLRSVPDIGDVLTGFALGSLTCCVNGEQANLLSVLSATVDVVQFHVVRGVPASGSCPPFRSARVAIAPRSDAAAASGSDGDGEGRSPVPPLPRAGESMPAAMHTPAEPSPRVPRMDVIPIPATVALEPGMERYSIFGTLEGAINRPRRASWTPEECLQDALANTVRRGNYHHGRTVRFPLPGLYVPQVVISRICRFSGWITVVVDLRALRLGIKVVDVRVGLTVRQLFQPGSLLHAELTALGRGDKTYACFHNQASCPCDQRISGETEAVTLLEHDSRGPNTFYLFSVSAPDTGGTTQAREASAAGGPGRSGTRPADSVAGARSTFTVFDRIHHYRVLECNAMASIHELTAIALAQTPELTSAEGIRLQHGVPGLPNPQIVLAEQAGPCRVTPIVYSRRPLQICTVEEPQELSAFQLALAFSENCKQLKGAPQQIARGTAVLLGRQGPIMPFAENQDFRHEAIVLRGFSRSQQCGQEARQRPVPPMQPDTRSEEWTSGSSSLWVLRARAPPCHVEVEPWRPPAETFADVVSVAGLGSMPSLFWPVVRPHTVHPGACLLMVPRACRQEAPNWGIVDIRRVGHPPLLPFQVLPMPFATDLSGLLELAHCQIPSLAPVKRVLIDEFELRDIPVAVAMATVFTLMSTECGDAEPALISNLHLMELRPGLRVAFNQFHARDWKGRASLPPAVSSASEIAEDGSSASFLSGTVDLENDDVALPLPTSTSTTTSRPQGSVRLPRLTFFSSAGGSKPNVVHTDGVCFFHQIVARHAKMLFDKGFLPSRATIFTSQRVHNIPGYGEAVFLASGQDGQSGQPVWCLTPQWHEPVALLLPLFSEIGLGEILQRVRWKGGPPPCVAVNGVRWDGLPRFFFSADVVQLAYRPSHLKSRPMLDLRTRMYEHQAAHFPASGPALEDLRTLTEPHCLRFLDRHFRKQFEVVERPLGPWRPCPHVVLVGHGMPVMRVTVGVHFAPTEALVQRFFDDHLQGHFSCRRIVDTKWAAHNAFVFFAAAPWAHSTLWVTTVGDELDAFELLDERHSLDCIPAPDGFEFRAAECRGMFGIASLRRREDDACVDPPGFLTSMALPPYPLPPRTIDADEDSSPSFAVPGTPDEPPPISSTSNASSSTSVDSVSSAVNETALELASPVVSSPVEDGTYVGDATLTVEDVFGNDSDPAEAAAGVSLLQTRLSERTLPLPDHTYVQFWVPTLAPVCLEVAADSCISEVQGRLQLALSVDFLFHIVPLFPPEPYVFQCVATPLGSCAIGRTILVHLPSGDASAVQVGPTDRASDLIDRLQLPNGSFYFAGRPWSGALEGCYDGMQVTWTPSRDDTADGHVGVSVEPGMETTPFRTFAAQNGVRASCSETPRTILSLDALLSKPAAIKAPHTALERRAHVGASLDRLLHILAPLQLTALEVTLPRLPMHPRTSAAVHALPCWNGKDSLQGVVLHVDGSFTESDNIAGWAVVATG